LHVKVKGKVDHAPQDSVGGSHLPFPGLEPVGGEPLMSVTRGQCDARSTVTFPAARRHRPLAGTKLYCLVTEARVCYQLAMPRVELDSEAARIRTIPLRLQATHLHKAPCWWCHILYSPPTCSPLSSSITHSLFHSWLKTHLFHKSVPP